MKAEVACTLPPRTRPPSSPDQTITNPATWVPHAGRWVLVAPMLSFCLSHTQCIVVERCRVRRTGAEAAAVVSWGGTKAHSA